MLFVILLLSISCHKLTWNSVKMNKKAMKMTHWNTCWSFSKTFLFENSFQTIFPCSHHKRRRRSSLRWPGGVSWSPAIRIRRNRAVRCSPWWTFGWRRPSPPSDTLRSCSGLCSTRSSGKCGRAGWRLQCLQNKNLYFKRNSRKYHSNHMSHESSYD